MPCGDLNRKEIQRTGDICKHKADSLWCIAETYHIVKELYSYKN